MRAGLSVTLAKTCKKRVTQSGIDEAINISRTKYGITLLPRRDAIVLFLVAIWHFKDTELSL